LLQLMKIARRRGFWLLKQLRIIATLVGLSHLDATWLRG
jgi:hypothetical protein